MTNERMNAFSKFWIGAWLAAASWCVQAQMPEAPEMAVKAYLLMDVTANQAFSAHEVFVCNAFRICVGVLLRLRRRNRSKALACRHWAFHATLLSIRTDKTHSQYTCKCSFTNFSV
jgi:hypothetical protein